MLHAAHRPALTYAASGCSWRALLYKLNWSVALGLPETVVHVPTALLQEKQLFQLLCVTPGCFAAPKLLNWALGTTKPACEPYISELSGLFWPCMLWALSVALQVLTIRSR